MRAFPVSQFSLTPAVLVAENFVSEDCANAPHFALHEGPPHSSPVLLTDKVNRGRNVLPNSF